ncbi:ribonuclease III [Tsuneonella flava]|uniref:ribonuclease III n=1 Tax=Tsuneonella flava TaxID=2055955 RepID=UPI001F172E08|nr:ribonuclease III [Tsuneonella flava]
MSDLWPQTRVWLEQIGFSVASEDIWLEALTHGSLNVRPNYERLEFLGDRVLGLSMAEWLFENSNGNEGQLAQRFNALVSRDTCARIAREIGVPKHVRLGKQARDDGAHESDNVLCDVMESLLGANHREAGFEASRQLVRKLWKKSVDGASGRSKHPKSALQEWAAGNRRKPPTYELVDRSGPDHRAKFTVRVTVGGVGSAEGTATSKQDAETSAAQAFMEQFG